MPGEVWAAEDEDVFVEAFVGVDAPVGRAAPEDVFIEGGGFEVHGVFPAVGQADVHFGSCLLDALEARAEQVVAKGHFVQQQSDLW